MLAVSSRSGSCHRFAFRAIRTAFGRTGFRAYSSNGTVFVAGGRALGGCKAAVRIRRGRSCLVPVRASSWLWRPNRDAVGRCWPRERSSRVSRRRRRWNLRLNHQLGPHLIVSEWSDLRRDKRVGSRGAKTGVMVHGRLAFDHEMVREGVYRITVKQPLETGQYGFIFALNGCGTGGALTFSVPSTPKVASR